MRTVVITGSRQWSDPMPLEAVLAGADALIVGDCPPDRRTRSSADALALRIALRWDIVPQVFAASSDRATFLRHKGVPVESVSDWRRDGKPAGPLRNAAIAAAARAALALGEVDCHAFPLASSSGTYDCVRRLEAVGLRVTVHRAQQRQPVSLELAPPRHSRLLLFWGHEASSSGIGPECLSQWYPAEFVVAGVRFRTAEHYMMHRKALLFGDGAIAEKIMRCELPRAAKELGRAVRGFDPNAWSTHSLRIVVEGNRAKFSQHARLATYLLGTHNAVLAEASPYDRIWGIGLAPDDPRAGDPRQWRGTNQLGNALMVVRAELQRERAQAAVRGPQAATPSPTRASAPLLER